MPYSTRTRVNLQATGANLDSWGSVLNSEALALIDEALQGTESIALTGANYTLSSTNGASDESRNASFRFTGTGGVSVIYPSVECFKGVRNDSTASIIFGYSAGSGVTIPAGAGAIVQGDGTTMRQVVATVSSADLSTLFQATSTDTETIASSGDITFTLVESSRAFAPGMLIRAAVTASPGTNYMTGYVKTYSGTTLVMTATASGGSGSQTNWTITFDQATVGLPSQTGNANALLGTDGSAASWYARSSEAQAQTGTDALTWMPPVRVADAITYQAMKQGIHEFYVDAGAMLPAATNGAPRATTATGSNAVNYITIDFDQTTQEFAHFKVRMPKSWNEGTVTFIPEWTAASGSGGVVWALQGVAVGNDDAIDAAFGTEQTSTDTLIATGDQHAGPESSAITIAGSPAAGDMVYFRVKRNPSDGSDTLNADARLLGVTIRCTINLATDA